MKYEHDSKKVKRIKWHASERPQEAEMIEVNFISFVHQTPESVAELLVLKEELILRRLEVLAAWDLSYTPRIQTAEAGSMLLS